MATMKEIADLAGVSRGTVDRVLNHRGSVNPETEKKILEIVNMLDYHPNKAGIALAVQKKNLAIGVVLFGRDNPFFDDVIAGVNQKMKDLAVYGIRIITRRIPFDLEIELETIDELVADGINGLVLSPYNDERVRKRIDELWAQGIPCVTTNTDIPESKRIAFVGSDFYRCGQAAADLLHLIANRPIKVGIVTGSHKILCHEERIEGFRDAIAGMQPKIEIVDVVEAHDDDYESYDAVSSLLTRFPDIGAICYTASGMYGGCRRMLAMTDQSGREGGEVFVRTQDGCRMIVLGYDAVPTTVEMLHRGVITATITQQPELQGSLSVSILQDYLVNGNLPANPICHTDSSIKLKENV